MRQQVRREEFIICTEEGVDMSLSVRIRRNNLLSKECSVCPNMKKVTLDKVLHVLQTGENEVHVDAELREKTKLLG